MPHIQVVDEGLVGALVLGAGLGEVDHVQVVGFPELRQLAPGPQLLPEGLVPLEGHPEDEAPCEERTQPYLPLLPSLPPCLCSEVN